MDKEYPVLILSPNGPSGIRAMMVVAPVTTDVRSVAIEVKVGGQEGLLHEGVLRVAFARPGRINCNWLITLSHADLIRKAGALSSTKLSELDDALRRGEVGGFQ